MLSHLAREARLGGVLATQGWFWGWLQGRVGRCLRPGAALVLPAWHRPGRSRLLTSLEPPVPEAMMCPEGAGVRHGSVTGQLWAPRSSAEPASSGSSAAPVLGRGDFPSQKQRLISRGKLRGKKKMVQSSCSAVSPEPRSFSGAQRWGTGWRRELAACPGVRRCPRTEPFHRGALGGQEDAGLWCWWWCGPNEAARSPAGCFGKAPRGAVLGRLLTGEGGGDPGRRRAAITSPLAPGVSCG